MERLNNDNDFIIGIRDLSAENHWKRIETEECIITRPTILILGGDGVETEEEANGYAKAVGNFCAPFLPDVDIISVCYNKEGLYGYNYSRNIKNLEKRIFLPLVSRDGKRLSLEEACKNVRQLTIFGHCRGTNIFKNILEELNKDMLELGYSQAEINKVFNQLFLIAYASKLEDIPKTVNTVYAIASDDIKFPRDVANLWNHLESERFEKLNATYGEIRNMCYFSSTNYMGRNEKCYVAKSMRGIYLKYPKTVFVLSTTQGDRVLGHTLTLVAKDENWNSDDRANKTAGQVSLCLGIALSYSVGNSIKNQVSEELIEISLDEIYEKMSKPTQDFNLGK